MQPHHPARPLARQPRDLAAEVEAWWTRPSHGRGCEGHLRPVGDRWLCADCLGELLEPPPLRREVA